MYVLESKEEAERLERQNSIDLYSIDEEFKEIYLAGNEKVLDMGCGTGGIGRALLKRYSGLHYEGADSSDVRLKQASSLYESLSLKGKFSNLDALNVDRIDGSYDVVTSRFLLHHLENPYLALVEMFRVCRVGGKVVIVETDGFLFNIFWNNEEFMGLVEKLRIKWPTDFFIGRKLKSYMFSLGAKEVHSRIIPMLFQGNSRDQEILQYKIRFNQYHAYISGLIGKKDCERLFTLYIEALENPSSEIFYNKFVVEACR